MIRNRYLIVLLAACLSAPALAGDGEALDLSKVREQQAQIKVEVEAGKGRYADMPTEKRHELLAKQNSLLKLIEGKQTNDQLTEAQRVEAFNTLEWIEATINDAEDERMVCERYKPTGTNRPRTVCKTVAQRRLEREAAQDDLRDSNVD